MIKILINYLSLLIVLSFTFCFVSCTTEFRDETRILETILKESKSSLCDKKCVYVLYSDKGCGACVKLTRNFVMEHILNKSSFNCIVTGVSEKEVSISYSPKVQSQSNFVHDRNGTGLNLVALYPRVFFVESKEVINTIEINYGNAQYTFDVIRKFISE